MTLPFLGTEALSAGIVSRRMLKHHQPVHRNVYLPLGAQLTPVLRAHAAWLWSDRDAVCGGLSASALLGARWIDADAPAELFRVNGKPVAGIVIHRDALQPDEVCKVGNIGVTSPARTAFDLGRRKGPLRALIRVDALAHRTGVTAQAIAPLIIRHRGVRGLVQLREVLEDMDGGAESPQETLTRRALTKAGLPKPRTQIVVRDEAGTFVARLDMGFDEFKVAVEYDGGQHWTDPVQRAKDIDRWATLAELGWAVIRVSSDMLRNRPNVIVERTCAALRKAGAEWPVITRILRDCVS